MAKSLIGVEIISNVSGESGNFQVQCQLSHG
jgi:hypothetical protein